ncbi:hypothetical protein FL966_00675 [Caproiciproducens galactitolivorans]|uniref:Flagellar hook-length control protein FliK n=1 Tax=Caproiciproducens galactitolivorans TaxID=642589 RepID=A0A4Z0YB38_9FIRM|nr:hypothetical protein [Caproiciproducens galactitolivorans]QEY33692.1 hypothetical protein FL966_00675 [Caproiciproducens galactitolivorans]TGJ76180.1 hypothetical protein CAGA_16410 [Caproiciproducens galactitolivorans]
MPDNLRITPPIPNSDTINKIPTTKQTGPTTPIDPSKVVQPNTDKQGDTNARFEFLLNRNSVFNKFLEQLNRTPALSETLQKVTFEAFSRPENVHDSRTNAPFMKELTAAMKMEPADILKNLTFQSNNRTKFTGPIFDVLRNLLNAHAGDRELKQTISNFLKAYDGYFSTADTTQAIAKELDTLSTQIPNPYSKQLKELTKELITDQPVKGLDLNLSVLKEKVIPLLGKYVAASNDYGVARDNITLLVHNLARLNISSHQELVDTFTALLDYCKYELNLPEPKMNEIKSMFLKTVTEASQKPENPLFDSIIKMLSENMKQSSSSVTQSLCRDTLTSLLLDNSVYMPFNHIFLPINYNGQFMFTEIWIEKENEKEKSRRGNLESGGSPVRLYLTFDIKRLGYFEAAVSFIDGKADIQLNCPESLEKDKRAISEKIADIFAQNGLTAQKIELLTGPGAVTKKQILRRVYERKNVIDVTV